MDSLTQSRRITRNSVECPDENAIALFARGMVSIPERFKIESHLDGCVDCRELVAHLVRDHQPRGAKSEGEVPEAPFLGRGTNLGRYLLLKCVGRGGAGTVYAAYDPELDRKIAIKILRTEDDVSEELRRERLLEEAKALAKISHPNVIAVHDIGTFEGHVFVAMEFVNGVSLREWLREEPRPWREIVRIFTQAARGLSAAHHAGLVHRDFKAENVLVGKEGEVRVTDFGLAVRQEPSTQSTDGSSSGTRVRTVGGTPRYLAPEQWGGESGTPASDQFSFCASLFEALYGALPYAGPTSASYTGKMTEPKRGRSVPNWIARVLIRGMAVDPNARFATIDHLIAALQSGLRTKSAMLVAAAATAALLLVGWAANRGAEASAIRKVEVDLAGAAETFRQKALVEQRLLEPEGSLRFPYLVNALGQADNLDATMGLSDDPHDGLSYAHEVLRSADSTLKMADVLMFVDRRGRLVYDGAEESRMGQSLLPIEAIRRALGGQANEALWSPQEVAHLPVSTAHPEGDLLLVLARPVGPVPRPVGALLLGYWVKRSILPRLEKSGGSGHLILQSSDGARASLAFNPDAKLELNPASDEPQRLHLGSQHYLVRSFDLPGLSENVIGRASLLRNIDEELGPMTTRFRNDTFKVVGGLIASIWLAYLLSRVRLSKAADQRSV